MTQSLISIRALVCAGLFGAALAAPAFADSTGADQFGDPSVNFAPNQLVTLAEANNYVVASGGIGEGERAALESQAGRYSMRMVFSESNGQYIVADHVSLRKKGAEVMSVNNAGPLLYAQVPPGQYALSVSYRGVTQTRNVSIGSRAGDVHMVWPVALD
ncbi:MAG TPA: hypothetical protein VH105_06010 [Burkholderiales bacterium]|jgi:hypothetical protein|nr:hypothetical protein [Burkholderiales bacterium]